MEREQITRAWKVVFADGFPHGKPEQLWRPYATFNLDNLRGEIDDSSPSPDKGIGVLRNANAGGFVALSYVDREVPQDFAIQSWVFTAVTDAPRGQLNGRAFRVDPAAQRFYRVASNFAANGSLNLAYVGADSRNMPIYLRKWHDDEIPQGLPRSSGWHRLRVEVVDNLAEVYWDAHLLPGGPFGITRSAAGFAGLYANFIGNQLPAETKIDDFLLETS